MKGILVVTASCPPCTDMKKELEKLIETGEVEVVDFDVDPKRVTELVNKYHVDLPGLIIMGDNGQLVATS
jgi:hypothetical protein